MKKLIHKLHSLVNNEIPIPLDPILEGEGIEVVPFPFRGRLREVICNKTIGIRTDLYHDLPTRRELIAHALGHHFLHCGSRLEVYTSLQRLCAYTQERQANAFAALLLCPLNALSEPIPHWELAEKLEVPESVLLRRALILTREERDAIAQSLGDLPTAV